MSIRIMVLSLLLVGAARAEDGWQALAVEGREAGLQAEPFEVLLRRCREAGLSTDDTREITENLIQARRSELPTETVYAKIDEGLAKNIPVRQIVKAAELRVQVLDQAAALLAAHRAEDPRGRYGLIRSSAYALESGVPQQRIAAILISPYGDRPGRVMAAIEGLETLHAQNFPAEDAVRLMTSALERGMRRFELSQAVDLALRRHGEGADPAGIRLEPASPPR